MPKKKHAFRGMKKSTKMSILSCKKKNILVFVSPILTDWIVPNCHKSMRSNLTVVVVESFDQFSTYINNIPCNTTYALCTEVN